MKRVKRLCTEDSINKRSEDNEIKLTEKHNKQEMNSKIKESKDSKRKFVNTVKKINDYSKKIENVEFLIKLEQRNKSQLEDNYETKITKIENTIEKNEGELEKTLKELNVKESKIFEIQKQKLESFKQEIYRFETIYSEIEDRLEEIFNTINIIKREECGVYNQTFIIYEDYLSFNSELAMLKIKMKNLKEILVDIEKSYPKEFEFLLEDIQIEKDLKQLMDKKSKLYFKEQKLEFLLNTIKDKEKSKITLNKNKEVRKNDIKRISEEVSKIENLYVKFHLIITKNSGETLENIEKLEEYIQNNVSDVFSFDKTRDVVFNYFSEKNFDVENEINVLIIKNLYVKLDEMKKEFNGIMNDKNLHMLKLQNALANMEKRAEKGMPRTKEYITFKKILECQGQKLN